MHFKVETVVWWSNFLVLKGTNFESQLASPNITVICLSFSSWVYHHHHHRYGKHAIIHLHGRKWRHLFRFRKCYHVANLLWQQNKIRTFSGEVQRVWMTLILKITFFSDVTPFSLVERYWCFGETRYIHHLPRRKRQQFPPKYHHFSTRPHSNISQKMASSIITIIRISNCRYWSYCNSPKFSKMEWSSLFINIRIQVIIQNTWDQWTMKRYVKYVLILEPLVMMI